jgi:hypothetical protein
MIDVSLLVAAAGTAIIAIDLLVGSQATCVAPSPVMENL